jgi:hypothetical protein
MPGPDPLLPFGEYKPDVSDYEGIASQAITNVVPRGDGYGPQPDLQGFTSALAAACRGFFSARKSDGSVVIFAGTATKLYRLDNTTFLWVDVSKGGGSYASLSGTANWTFAQFGNLVFATQANIVLQVYDMSSSSAFADNAGSPPQAAYIAVVGQFLVLSGLLSLPYREVWSGIGDTTNWTAGVNQADFQDFADGGLLRGVAGGEYGVVFQDTTIRQMTYAPGSAYIFQFTRICEDQGLIGPYALTKAGSKIFFYSSQGFQQLSPGTLPYPIGKEKVDRSFFNDFDSANPQLFLATSDPNATRVYFAYKSTSGMAGLFDTVLAYDYILERWVPFHGIAGQYISTLAKPGLTLENLDVAATTTIAITGAADNGSGKVRLTISTINLPAMPTPPDGASVPTQLTTGTKVDIWNVGGTTEANGEGQTITVVNSTHIDLLGVSFVHAYTSGGVIAGPLDAMTVSLDSFPNATAPALAGFNSSNALGFFNGPNLEAKLESSEKGDLGTRIFVSGFRPVTDASAVLGSVSSRENLQATRVYSAEQPVDGRGLIPARVSTRYSRGKIRIPRGTTWTYAMGVEPEVRPDGKR